jgi:hypothetical protein
MSEFRLLSVPDHQLAPCQDKNPGLWFPWSLDIQSDFGPGPAPQAIIYHLFKIAPFGRGAVNMGDDVTRPDAGNLCRPAGYQLANCYPTVGMGDAVYADSAEIPAAVGGSCGRCGHDGCQ